MQLMYDLKSKTSHYADCFDGHVGAGTTGLKTKVIGGPSGTSCKPYGQAISTQGSARLKTTTDYQKLTGNFLPSRTVHFDRAPAGSGNWTTNYASTTSTSHDPNDNNWFKSFTVSGSNGSVSYDFRARIIPEPGLDGDTSAIFTLTWSTGC